MNTEPAERRISCSPSCHTAIRSSRRGTRVSPGAFPTRYQVLELLDQGGMGRVYRCLDRITHEQVALKLPAVEPGYEDIVRNALVAETRALGMMNHENIVALREAGQVGDEPYLATDFVAGSSLSQWADGPLTYSRLWPIVDQLLSALDHVHGRGVLHGDIKPANIMVEDCAGGLRVRLIDFGLSWHFQHPLELGCAPESLLLGPPKGCGTLGYMAPEQALGELHVSARADLYSVGAVLYRLLAGHRPKTTQGSPFDLRSFRVPARSSLTGSDAPEAVIDLTLRLLSVDPSERPASAKEVRNAWLGLRSLAGNAEDTLRCARPKRASESQGFISRRNLWASSLVAMMVER